MGTRCQRRQATGVQKRGNNTIELTGVRAPELKRDAPKAWTNPEPLFNGKNLDGWEPIGDPARSHWTVQDGLLVNQDHGANLRTKRTFDDFKVHYEVNCPDNGNSGFYLRGRYEVQIEYEPLSENPPERRIGSIYGRIAPSPELPRTPGQWETFDVTLVGRTVTVVRNMGYPRLTTRKSKASPEVHWMPTKASTAPSTFRTTTPAA